MKVRWQSSKTCFSHETPSPTTYLYSKYFERNSRCMSDNIRLTCYITRSQYLMVGKQEKRSSLLFGTEQYCLLSCIKMRFRLVILVSWEGRNKRKIARCKSNKVLCSPDGSTFCIFFKELNMFFCS